MLKKIEFQLTEIDRERLIAELHHEWQQFKALRWPSPYGQTSENCARRNQQFAKYAAIRDLLMGEKTRSQFLDQ